ncbi:MAG: class I SAM-dependent methyltransferase [Actinomycetaceae bacterium]|nr:class I SAM-dependent methyltransferase [Actinomycetaceae bacterium]
MLNRRREHKEWTQVKTPCNPFDDVQQGYSQARPRYPQGATEALLNLGKNIVELGAGSGILTAALVEGGATVTAVEPAAAMCQQFRAEHPHFQLVQAPAEDTGLPEGAYDLAVFSQSWHWVNAPAAAAEARRLLRPGGKIAIIYNQLDVERPWIWRLSRIMRSGDVRSVLSAPQVPGFAEPALISFSWDRELRATDVLELGRTHASYLRAHADCREKMQGNLRWYLFQHMGFAAASVVRLPYRTHLWVADMLPEDDNAV